MRTAYQYHHLSRDSQKIAQENNKGTDLTSLLYNQDGTLFVCSLVVDRG